MGQHLEGEGLKSIDYQQALNTLVDESMLPVLDFSSYRDRYTYLSTLVSETQGSSRSVVITPEMQGLFRIKNLIHYSPEDHIRSSEKITVALLDSGRIELTFFDRKNSQLRAYLDKTGQLDSLYENSYEPVYKKNDENCNTSFCLEKAEKAEKALQFGLRVLSSNLELFSCRKDEQSAYSELVAKTGDLTDGYYNFAQTHDRKRLVDSLAERHYHVSYGFSCSTTVDFVRGQGLLQKIPIETPDYFITGLAERAEIKKDNEETSIIFWRGRDQLVFLLDHEMDLSYIGWTRGTWTN
jgi:hypothetical protein